MATNLYPVASVIGKKAYAWVPSLFLIIVVKTIAQAPWGGTDSFQLTAYNLPRGSMHSAMYLEARSESETREQHPYWIVSPGFLS